MNNFLFLFLFILFSTNIFAQIGAITENGDEVILHEDGTWKYKTEVKDHFDSIPFNPTKYSKSANLSFSIKSQNLPVAIFYNTQKWDLKKGENPAEFTFNHKTEDAYGMFISEEIEIPLENLREIAFQNAQSVAPDCEIVKEDFRMVNGKKVLFMQMNGTTQGIKFSYLGYYYSDSNGTFQFVTYTSQNLLSKLQGEMNNLLNGILVH